VHRHPNEAQRMTSRAALVLGCCLSMLAREAHSSDGITSYSPPRLALGPSLSSGLGRLYCKPYAVKSAQRQKERTVRPLTETATAVLSRKPSPSLMQLHDGSSRGSPEP